MLSQIIKKEKRKEKEKKKAQEHVRTLSSKRGEENQDHSAYQLRAPI